MADAFFEPLGGNRFHSTEHTTGPWQAESQHLGPPSALLTRGLERLPAHEPATIARITIEILGPVPVAELEVNASIDRPGKSVELLAGEIRALGRTVVRGRAWRMIHTDTTAVATPAGEPLAPPSAGRPIGRPPGWGAGFLDAMEWRALRGAFDERGPATVWARQGVDLVAGEEPTGLQRLVVHQYRADRAPAPHAGRRVDRARRAHRDRPGRRRHRTVHAARPHRPGRGRRPGASGPPSVGASRSIKVGKNGSGSTIG